MSLTVSSISNDVSIDIRQVLVPTDTKLIGWIDRVHKDCLHSSLYSPLIVARQTFATIAGQALYTLAPTPGVTGAGPGIRRILGVFDSSRNRILFPIERASSPVSQVDKQEPMPGQVGSSQLEFGQPLTSPISLQAGQPGYFRYFPNAAVGAPALALIPVPATALNISVTYELQVITLVNETDPLLIPEDGRDMVVAGVNYLANIFLKRMDEAQIWAQIFSSLKTGQNLV